MNTKVVDAHQHLGDCCVFDLNVTEEYLMEGLEQNNIDLTIVQPCPGARRPEEAHARVAALARKHPDRIRGLACLSPHQPEEQYFNQTRQWIEEHGFVGVKLHTVGHAVSPVSADAEKVFRTAVRLGVPVMIHTGAGVPFSLPSLVIPMARQYPELKIVLAHSGSGLYSLEALVVAQECPNVHLETSWCSVGDIAWFVRTVGADRVMFGADIVSNIPIELAKYGTTDMGDEERHTCLSETAIRVFGL
ncbi:MAG: amidohydrolase [Firmicutes bacterium]|nr:amidohydrolase [Bacillota bacterium]